MPQLALHRLFGFVGKNPPVDGEAELVGDRIDFVSGPRPDLSAERDRRGQLLAAWRDEHAGALNGFVALEFRAKGGGFFVSIDAEMWPGGMGGFSANGDLHPEHAVVPAAEDIAPAAFADDSVIGIDQLLLNDVAGAVHAVAFLVGNKSDLDVELRFQVAALDRFERVKQAGNRALHVV